MTSPAYSGAPTSIQPGVLQQPTPLLHPVLSAPGNYQYPRTSGLISSLSQPGAISSLMQNMGSAQNASPGMLPQDTNTPAPYTGPDYSQIALQMAGNPHAGAYAPAAVPTGSFISNPATTSSGGSSALGTTAAGLLGLLAANPSLAKSLGGTLGSGLQALLGTPVAGSAAATGNLGDSPLGSPTIDTGTPGSGLDFSTGNIDLSGADTGTPTEDTGDLTSLLESLGFSGAGGQAATGTSDDVLSEVQAPGVDMPIGGDSASSAQSSTGLLGGLGLGVGAIGGLLSGTPTGDAQAGIDATKLAAQNGLFGAISPGINSAASASGNALGLYSGLEKGGVTGDAQAAISAAQLANSLGTSTGLLSSGVGATASGLLSDIAAPLAVYNAATNWQSGATVPDALNDAGAGAAIGTTILPGIGSLIGALGGAAVGAISSIAGGGKPDPETQMLNSLDTQAASVQQAYLSNPNNAETYLTGVFDGKNNTPGHSAPLEQVFGRMGEGNFNTALTSTLSSAASSGAINANTPPAQIYSQIVAPWLASKGAAIDPNGVDVNGNPLGQNMITAVTSLISNYQAHGFSQGTIPAEVAPTDYSGDSLLAAMAGYQA